LRRDGQNAGQGRAIKGSDTAIKAGFGSDPDVPWNMGDVIFKGRAGFLSRISPIVFGDVLLEAALRRREGRGGGRGKELRPIAAMLPGILDFPLVALGYEVVFHRKGDIVLAINPARAESDCGLGNNLLDENDAAPKFVSHFPVYIEAQIHFFEFAMKRDGDFSPQFCFAKSKAYEAEIRFPLKRS